jgi:hypothetical protein
MTRLTKEELDAVNEEGRKNFENLNAQWPVIIESFKQPKPDGTKMTTQEKIEAIDEIVEKQLPHPLSSQS